MYLYKSQCFFIDSDIWIFWGLENIINIIKDINNIIKELAFFSEVSCEHWISIITITTLICWIPIVCISHSLFSFTSNIINQNANNWGVLAPWAKTKKWHSCQLWKGKKMRDRCLGDGCELIQSLQSVLKCLILTLWLLRDEHLQLATGFTRRFFFVEMRDRNAFVPWSLSLPVKRHEGAAAAARRVPPCARCPDTGSGLHWCSRASLTQIRPAPRACPGPHTDVASLFLWLCVCWWLGRTTQAQSLKQRPSQSTACSRILLLCLWARLCQQTLAAFSVDACLCNKKLMP